MSCNQCNQLKSDLEFKDELFLTLAHELKNSLTTVSLQIQLMSQIITKESPQGDLWKKALKSGEISQNEILWCTRMIEKMIQGVSYTNGHLNLNLDSFDFANLLKSVVERIQLNPSNSQSSIHISGDLSIEGRWDKLRIEQVLLNLISNAIKYGNGKPIHLHLKKTESNLQLSITDQGIGIEEKDQNRVFDKFVRAVPKNHSPGLGLGLYLVQNIVKAHNGALTLESQPGKGSTFTMILPLQCQDQKS